MNAPVETILTEEEPVHGLLPPRKLLEQFVRIPSFEDNSKEAAMWLHDHLQHGNFDEVYIDDMQNVIATRGDGDNTVLLASSLETYRGHIPVRIEHDQLYGRGTVHSKGPLIAGIVAINELDAEVLKDKTCILVASSRTLVSENNGLENIVKNFSPDAAIYLEPTGLNTIVTGYKGAYGFLYNNSQPNAHYTNITRRTGDMAIRFIHELSEYLNNRYPRRTWPHLEDQLVSPNIEIHSMNVANDGLIDSTTMKLYIRYPHGFDLEELKEKIEEIKGYARVQTCTHIPASHAEEKNALVQAFESAIIKNGETYTKAQRTTTSGFSILSKAWPDTPMLTYGPGDFELDQTPEERIDLNEFEASISILQDALTAL